MQMCVRNGEERVWRVEPRRWWGDPLHVVYPVPRLSLVTQVPCDGGKQDVPAADRDIEPEDVG